MDIQHLLSKLEAVLLEAKKVPGTKMRLVDTERCFQIIDQMVLAIPEEIKKAQRIEQEKEHIIARAKEEADRLRALAREEAQRYAEDSTVLAIAKNMADSIQERARKEAEQMRAEADQYALEVLTRLRDEVAHILQVISNGIQKLEQAQAQRNGGTSADEHMLNPGN